MNNKGSAVVAVTFPGGKTGKVVISEYPQCITMFCRLQQPPQGGVPPDPEIDVEVFCTANNRAIIRGTGSSTYAEQIRKALLGYLEGKNNFVQSC